jgi:uncharacterized membrane protein
MSSHGHEDPSAAEAVAPHVRRLRQRALSNRLRESLLFLPAVLLIGAVLLEQVVAAIDRHAEAPLLQRFQMPPDAAITLFATIAGATITTAGVVFSLLVVTLQLASGQFSPRVLRTFWRDRFGQVLVGLLLASFAFSVLALTGIDTSAEYAPTLTVACMLLLTFASLITMVAFLNRISRGQYVGRIIERIGAETLSLIAELPYGPQIGMRVGDPVEPPDPATLGPSLVVIGHADGWVQQISRRAVVAAVPPGSVVRLETRVGGYLVRGEPLATVWPRPDAATTARVARLVAEAVIISYSRTMQQDIDFGLRQLNDIGLRALSAAVNDPTTAIEVVLRVASVLRPLLIADLPPQSVRDEQGRVLLTPWDLDHGEYVRHAFDQTRVYGGNHPQVMLAMVRAIVMLRNVARDVGRTNAVEALHRELELAVQASARAGVADADMARLLEVSGVADPR